MKHKGHYLSGNKRGMLLPSYQIPSVSIIYPRYLSGKISNSRTQKNKWLVLFILIIRFEEIYRKLIAYFLILFSSWVWVRKPRKLGTLKILTFTRVMANFKKSDLVFFRSNQLFLDILHFHIRAEKFLVASRKKNFLQNFPIFRTFETSVP